VRSSRGQARGRESKRKRVEYPVDCVQRGFNITSCIVVKLLEAAATGQALKLPKFSREVVLRLKDFRIDIGTVQRYLETVRAELEKLYPLVLRLTIETETPLAVHLRNPYMPLEIGLSWHPIFNAPYIPATSLKGVLRAGARRGACGMSQAELFGFAGQEGALVVTDALPTVPDPVEPDVLTPHYGEPRIREVEASPTPLVFPVIRPGATFDFFIASQRVDVKCAQEIYELVKEALSEGLGAKTRVGYGVVRLK